MRTPSRLRCAAAREGQLPVALFQTPLRQWQARYKAQKAARDPGRTAEEEQPPAAEKQPAPRAS